MSANDPLRTVGLLRSRQSVAATDAKAAKFPLLNHLVRAQQQRLRDREPDRFGSLQVDDQLDARSAPGVPG